MAKRLVLNARLDSSAADHLRNNLVGAHGDDLVLDGAHVDMLGGLCAELLLSARHLWQLQQMSLSIENASIALIDNLKRLGLSLDDVMTGGGK